MAEASVATDRSRAVCRRPGSAWIQLMESHAQDHSRNTNSYSIWGKELCAGLGR